jgi:hypothetical protein
MLWYRRFWTGNCAGLGFCAAGTPNWNEAVQEIRMKAPPAKRADVGAQACRVGRLIGLEWARDNSIRKIDTQQLLGFVDELQTNADVEAALNHIEQEAHDDLDK